MVNEFKRHNNGNIMRPIYQLQGEKVVETISSKMNRYKQIEHIFLSILSSKKPTFISSDIVTQIIAETELIIRELDNFIEKGSIK